MQKAVNQIGFVIPSIPGERRRAILPLQLDMVSNPGHILIETGYGDSIGITDDEYASKGACIVSRREVEQASILCDVKGELRKNVGQGQVLIGWFHLEEAWQGALRQTCIANRATVIEWSNLYVEEDGGKLAYLFEDNRPAAGIASVRQALTVANRKYEKIALLGAGRVGKGALAELDRHGLKAADIYGRDNISTLPDKIGEYDLIIDAMLFTPKADARIPDEIELLEAIRPDAMLINIGWGVFRSSPKTSIDNPLTTLGDGFKYYGVSNSPSYIADEVTAYISGQFSRYINPLISGEYLRDPVLCKAVVIKQGATVDKYSACEQDTRVARLVQLDQRVRRASAL